MKAVLDPNVIVSGLLTPDGPPGKILEMWFRGDFELVISPKLTDELERVLGYTKIRKRITEEEADESMQLLRKWASHADDPAETASIRSSDPDDDYLIALAESSAAALVSGDSDLLQLNGKLPIYSPKDFLGLVANELKDLIEGDVRYEDARERALKALANAKPRGGPSWQREDLHER